MLELDISTTPGDADRIDYEHSRDELLEFLAIKDADVTASRIDPDVREAIESAFSLWAAGRLEPDLAELVVRGVNTIALRLGYEGLYAKRVEYGEIALEVAESRGDRLAVAELCASTIAWALLQTGEPDRAREYAERGLRAAVSASSPKYAAEACRILSGLCRDAKDAVGAQHWAELAAGHATSLNDTLLKRRIWMDLGFAAQLSGEYSLAERINRKLLTLYLTEGNLELAANFYGGLAITVLNQGRRREAKHLYFKALEVGKSLQGRGHRVMIAEAEFGLAVVLEAEAAMLRRRSLVRVSRARLRKLEAEARAYRDSASLVWAELEIARPSRADDFVVAERASGRRSRSATRGKLNIS